MMGRHHLRPSGIPVMDLCVKLPTHPRFLARWRHREFGTCDARGHESIPAADLIARRGAK